MPTQLDEIALGVVVGRSGQILPLSKPHDNIFLYDEDAGDDLRLQSFIREIIDLYSSPGDWVFAGPTGIGMQFQKI